MTPRQRLIELSASYLRRSGGDITDQRAHEAIEHIAIHTYRGECEAYYRRTTYVARAMLVTAVANRAQTQTRRV